MAPILTFAMVAALTPGPNNIILSANAVNYGFKKTIPLILGVFFGFLTVLSLCLIGVGELYKSIPTAEIIIKITATIFLIYLSYKIFVSSTFSEQKSLKRFSFKDIYFFQIINPKVIAVSTSSSAVFIQNKFIFQIEFLLIFLCFVISTASSAVVWALIGHSIRKYLNKEKEIKIFNKVMGTLLFLSVIFIFV